MAQIDRLTLEARHTLQMAAVIGPTFLSQVLDVLASSEHQLDEQLSLLRQHEHILADGVTDLGRVYTFRHILVQESAYSTLLYERRRQYHRQVAETLERLFPARMVEQAVLLSFHYQRAADLDKALYYQLLAADQARLLFAQEEAEALYGQALELLDEQEMTGVIDVRERRARTFLKMAQVRANALDFDGAQVYYERAFELFDQLQPSGLQADKSVGPKRIRLAALEHGPLSLDPGLSDVRDVSEIVGDLFEGLVELDTELNVLPALARRWRTTDNGSRYLFELRPDLRWSDGVALTAHDFVFAWRRNLDPATGAGLAQALYAVQGAEAYHRGQNHDPASIGVRALDDLRLEISLQTPTPYFPYVLAETIAFPQPADSIRVLGDAWSAPETLVCNGPFRIGRWEQGREILLERNPFYRGLMPGNLDEVQLRFVEPTLGLYEQGVIDYCRIVDRAVLPGDYDATSFLMQYLATLFLVFACQSPPFDQPLVRQAFAASIDKEALSRSVWAGLQRPATGGIIPPGMPGHSPQIGLRFDPDLARDLLEQAGYTSGPIFPALPLPPCP